MFTSKLNDRDFLDAFGIKQDDDSVTPEEVASSMPNYMPLALEEASDQAMPKAEMLNYMPLVLEEASNQAPVVSRISPTQKLQVSKNPFMEGVPNIDDVMANLPKQDSQTNSTEPALTKSEQLIAEYQKMLGKDQQSLEEARSRDRMLKVGGSIGDALATYLNAKNQMNVKAPGVQIQQGAGLGKVADMFATAPEIASDVAQRREAMMKQYAELAKGERSQARLTSEENRAKRSEDLRRELTKAQIEAGLKEAEIKASEKGSAGPTPYQQYMIGKSEKKEAKLSDKQTAELEGLENVRRSLDEVQTAKEGVNTGRYASAIQSGVDLIPGIEPDQNFVALRQLSGTQLFDYVKNQSGVSYSVKELEQLKSNMPNVDDDDKTFLTKLNTVRDIVKRKQEEKVKALQGQGKDVSGFKKQTTAKKAVAGDIVTVKGKKYRVAEDGDSLIPVGK